MDGYPIELHLKPKHSFYWFASASVQGMYVDFEKDIVYLTPKAANCVLQLLDGQEEFFPELIKMLGQFHYYTPGDTFLEHDFQI